MIALIVVLVLIVLLVFIAIGIYNTLVVKRNRVKNGWSQIDVQLKRRIDLIPNLVETVKGYAAHEEAIFERLAEARSQAISAKGPAESAKANNMLSDTLKTLFAVVENYPNLKANENFLKLQEELSGTENKISFARQFYNDVVMDYNNSTQMFPSSVFAGMFGFKQAEFYNVPEAEREPPKVKF
jgi:LemA protein